MRYPAGFISAFYDPLKNPDAPTIGTATAGIGSVSVSFTAPSNVGGSAISGYTVQAIKTSDGSITFTNGASSPISVTGLAGTAYTFKVLATNSYGSSALSAASNSATPLVIGAALGGGFFAGQISTAGNGIADYNLVVGPAASAQDLSIQWKTTNTSTAGTTSDIDGPANSAAMNDASHPAAQFCEGLTIGGFSDWYMPAKNELEVCYYNLKPNTTSNNTSSGINPNSVPARASNYTSGDPAQTTAAAFQTGGAEAFTPDNNKGYWSSTESSVYQAREQRFTNGTQDTNGKANLNYVRAIRRVAV
jgi:hypothetical protein